MHVVEQVSRGARRPAPVVRDPSVRKMRVHLARMHFAAGTDEIEHLRGAIAAGLVPAASFQSWVHQRVELSRDEAVVDEEIFFDAERGVTPLEVACVVVPDAMPQRQVLCPRGRANRVGLDESQGLDRRLQRERREQAACDGVASQVVEVHGQ